MSRTCGGGGGGGGGGGLNFNPYANFSIVIFAHMLFFLQDSVKMWNKIESPHHATVLPA